MLANKLPFGGLPRRNMYFDVGRIELHPEGKRLGSDGPHSRAISDL